MKAAPGEVEIGPWLSGEGFETAWAQHQARTVLEGAALTRPGKRAMTGTKVERARAALDAYLFRVCGDADCDRVAAERRDGRLVVESQAARCEVCGGSNNRRAAVLLARACRAKNVTRILVLGGTAANHADLAALLEGSGVTLRCVDGKAGSHTKSDALPNLKWAEVCAIWASTPLPHKVSVSYTDERPADLPMITVSRRGLEALCRELLRTVEGM